MQLAPLLAASPAIQIHVFAAAVALGSSAAVFVMPKGTPHHVLYGRIAALALLATALSSFWITRNGQYSWIHILSLVTLTTVSFGLRGIRQGKRRTHAANMIGAVSGLAVAALFTMTPGRVLHAVFFGG